MDLAGVHAALNTSHPANPSRRSTAMRPFRRLFGRRKHIVINEMHFHYPQTESADETVARVLRRLGDDGIGSYL